MNLKNNTLLLLGDDRTGTTSIWEWGKQHPQIHSSKIKEPLSIWYPNWTPIDLKKYLTFWDHIKVKDGDVLLDATPNWWNKLKYGVGEIITNIDVKRICCLYTLRKPYTDLWVSKLQNQYLFSRDRKKYFFFDENLKIKEDIVKSIIKKGLNSRLKRIRRLILNRENILILNFLEISKKQDEIFDFLEIEKNHHFEFPHENQAVKDNPATEMILDFIEQNKEYIDEAEAIDLENIKKEFGRWFK